MSCDLGSVKRQTLALYFIGAISGYGIKLRGVDMAVTFDAKDLVDQIVNDINDKLDKSHDRNEAMLEKAVSDDLYEAYRKILGTRKIGNKRKPSGLHNSASRIPYGIAVDGDNSPKQIYGFSRYSTNEYGDAVAGGLRITINNILDLNWDKGYVALPERGINSGWKNPAREIKRKANVTLGNEHYRGTPGEVMRKYTDDIQNRTNSGPHIDQVLTWVTANLFS